LKKKQERMKNLQDLSKCDRAEKKYDVVKDSKANELKFGANIVKFQPPPPKKGG
jgi:hypothetical protein